MALKNPPDGYHSVTPYLIVDDGVAALDFYAKAFGAVELFRLPMGDKIGHAEIRIGDSTLMISDEWPDMGILGPKSRGGTTASFLIYVDDVDTAYAKAVGVGCVAEREPADQFWGDRMGSLFDPFGHRWSLATHIEDVSAEEMNARMAALGEGDCAE